MASDYDKWKLASPDEEDQEGCKYCGEECNGHIAICDDCFEEQKADFFED
jgi:hypothetical protein